MGTQGQDREVVFLSGKRTGFGAFGGSLKSLTATELGVFAAQAALGESGTTAADVGHTFFGNALQTSADAIYLARHVALGAGVPEGAGALTVNRLCGSGLEAIVQGAKEILLGDSDVTLCGGTESMSMAPHVVRGARWGRLRLGDAGGFFEDVLWQALIDPHCGMTMAQTAENLAERYGVTRRESDTAALASQRRAKRAWDEGRLDAEITPVKVRTRRGQAEYRADEHMRPETTIGDLATLRPYFKKDGLVTAGNASGIGDGAAACVLADAAWAKARGLRPLGRLISWGFAGVDPSLMGIGPAPAARIALERAKHGVKDMDLVEVNEAFAPQYIAVERELGLDPAKTNVDGGAIALTHPLAASGTRIIIHLLHELQRRGGGLGLGSACIGGGQGGAMVVDVPPD